jgi:predicted RNA-binding Zn ribbon-like protein
MKVPELDLVRVGRHPHAPYVLSTASRSYTLLLVTLLAERQPGERAPAPGDLALVQAFVNTFWDLDRDGTDRLDSPGAVARWLAQRGLLDRRERLSEADLVRARAVREGLRALLLVNNGLAESRDAVDALNRALRGPGLFVQLDPARRPEFIAHRRDFDRALASLSTIVAVAQIEGNWARLKACRGDHCGWAFYDHSRNQSGTWCSMSLCGSRAKSREYRRRKRQSRADS